MLSGLLETRQKTARAWFEALQQRIVDALEVIEREAPDASQADTRRAVGPQAEYAPPGSLARDGAAERRQSPPGWGR